MASNNQTLERDTQASHVTAPSEVISRVEKVGDLFNTNPSMEGPVFCSQVASSKAVSDELREDGPVEKVGDFFNKQADVRGISVTAYFDPAGPIEHAPPNNQPAAQLGLPRPAPLLIQGRPKTLTPDLCEELCLLLSVGLSRRQAAAYLGVNHSTISYAAQRDAELAEDLHRAEELAMVKSMMTVFAESQKNWRAAAWLLDHKRKHRPALTEEEKKERQEERLADAKRRQELRNAVTLLREEAEDEAKVREKLRREKVQDAITALDDPRSDKEKAEFEAERAWRRRHRAK